MIKPPVILDIIRIGPDGSREHVQRLSLGPGRYSLGRAVDASIQIDHKDISRTHLFLDVGDAGVTVTDNQSTNGTLLGEQRITSLAWDGRLPIRLPHHELRHVGVTDAPAVSSVGVSETSGPWLGEIWEPEPAPRETEEDGLLFAASIFSAPVVSVNAVRASGYYHSESEYLTLGGGIGSFVWVDHLRCYGVPKSSIRVIGANPICYQNYARYCRNSQIPIHERLRSNSISTPDNIWGFPGYASRETWSELRSGNLAGIAHIFDVFGEPAITQSYTPKAGQVFTSLDREADRIGWREMFLEGRVIALRKTDDGRFAVAWRTFGTVPGERREQISIARYVHVSTGYPSLRFEGELRKFRQNPEYRDDAHLVVNAYDPHDELYTAIERSGRPETVIVRGRGIVASRILQRLSEARVWNNRITIVHQMRNPVPPEKVARWGSSTRIVINDVEHQPFNWPKSCWGGDYRQEIEKAGEAKRAAMFGVLGGTTTAVRRDWIAITNNGTAEGWYRKVFGTISSIVPTGPRDDRKLNVVITPTGGGGAEPITADFLIDCTGLIANPEESTFLRDLVKTYGLKRNRVSGANGQQNVTGIHVTNDFEIEGLRNGPGRVYAAGAITIGGPYAAVDSFLGLQYAALRSVDHLHEVRAPNVSSFGPARSFSQWVKWCRGKSPD
jgi:pSer/pThr/pTyr-binding forkhead associated (FHA) protein